MCRSSRGQQVSQLRCTGVCCSIHWWRWSWVPWCIFHLWPHTRREGCSSSHTTPHGSLLKIISSVETSVWESQRHTHAQNKPSTHRQLCLEPSFSVHFLSFDSFKFYWVIGGVLTFLAHSSAGQTHLSRWTLQGESDTVQRWDGGEHTGVTEEGDWRTDVLVKTVQIQNVMKMTKTAPSIALDLKNNDMLKCEHFVSDELKKYISIIGNCCCNFSSQMSNIRWFQLLRCVDFFTELFNFHYFLPF